MAEKKFEKQLTGMAGEFLTLGKLFKKGLQASITFGNAKGIDIFAENANGKTFKVQVKTSRKSKENFRIQKDKIEPDYICVFVALNDFEKNEDYYIVKGSEVLKDIDKFFIKSKTAIKYKSLTEYIDKWNVFDK